MYCFFDSYAIIEIIKGSKAYQKFKDNIIITTKLNLFEVYYYLLRDFGVEVANHFLEEYSRFSMEFGNNIIRSAAAFRLEYKSRNSPITVSMTDSIGYKLAEYLGIKFLTGDDQFKGLSNVEFVK